MQTDNLARAIEHLEAAKELLQCRMLIKNSRTDDVFHNAVMSIGNHISLLRNELHYAEKEKLANWKWIFQDLKIYSISKSPKHRLSPNYRVRRTKKALSVR